MEMEDRFELRMMSAVDPPKLTVSNVEILCHMTTVTLIIIGGVLSAHEKRDSIMDRTVRVTYGIDSTGHLQRNFMTVKNAAASPICLGEASFRKSRSKM